MTADSGAEMILKQDEALKREIRREEAEYDAVRDMNRDVFNN
jgi:hypothetical protein